jgi:selenocysteine-specific elongation factor
LERRNVIIGTAGHIDHGKTVLVRALTGRDTDRLAEEKERGISIDLGFAPLELSDGSIAGIVDVPGHENFIRNMMAGATGVDLALLVVAADDGVMPQTREHLAILELLGVERGVVAVTKADLAEDGLVELVVDEVGDLLSGSVLEGSAVIPVSGLTGKGLDELKAEIERQVSAVTVKQEDLPARLPIDRVFTLRGIGTVVTGTLWSGTVSVEDTLELLPRGLSVRVRNLQVHGSERGTAFAGERVAVNLAGVAKKDLCRGDVLATTGWLKPTYMIDAEVQILGEWKRPLKRASRLRFHHGTREVLFRIYPLETDIIEPPDRLAAQLRLENHAVCAPGDRFVIRSYSPVTTIGGGTVIDPHPTKHRQKDSGAVEALLKLEKGGPEQVVEVHLSRSGEPVGARALVLASGLPPSQVERGLCDLASDGRAVVFGEGESARYVSAPAFGDAAGRVLETLRDFHRDKPLSSGMDKETLRKKALSGWESKAAEQLFETLSRRSELETEGNRVRLPGSSASLDKVQEGLLEDMVTEIRSRPVTPPTVSELSGELGERRETVEDLLALALRDGRVTRVSPELYFSSDAIDEVKEKLESAVGDAGITVSDFRKLIGTTRKYALPLLEYFDRSRFTLRVGDLRKLR